MSTYNIRRRPIDKDLHIGIMGKIIKDKKSQNEINQKSLNLIAFVVNVVSV